MSRVVRSPWLVVLALIGLCSAPFLYAACARTTSSISAAAPTFPQQQPPQPSPVELQDSVLLAGLDAKALTAVGLSAQAASSFVGEFRDDCAQNLAALTTAESNMATAQVASDALRRKIQSGKGSQEDVT